ncbi:MAG: ankyrin repeat domain-containing protein [Verrucomicrobia bacterium]|nr:ankyrin repeat domain-containing protein [Verrucomicrobiota bacterium]
MNKADNVEKLRECIHCDDHAGASALLDAHPELLHQRLSRNWGAPMAYAANLGRMDLIRDFAQRGAKDFQHAFDRSCLQGQLEAARWMMEKGATLKNGITMGCCETLNSDGLEFLLDLGAAVADEHGDKLAPIALVLQTYSRNPIGKHQCLEALVRYGADLPDTVIVAFHRGRIDLLETHLLHDPELLQRRFSYEELYPTALGCHASTTQHGLHGAPLAGCGLLHMAVDFYEEEIFHWLLDRGADPNQEAIVDEDGFGKQTPLFSAVVSQSYQCGRQQDGSMAKELLRRGAKPLHRATLKKAILFSDDEILHEYRNVTPYEFGKRFSHQNWVNPLAMNAISES